MDFVDEAESQLIRDGKMLGQRIPDVAKEYLRAAHTAEVERVKRDMYEPCPSCRGESGHESGGPAGFIPAPCTCQQPLRDRRDKQDAEQREKVLQARVERLERDLDKIRRWDDDHPSLRHMTVAVLDAYWNYPEDGVSGLLTSEADRVARVDRAIRNRLWPPTHGGDCAATSAAEEDKTN